MVSKCGTVYGGEDVAYTVPQYAPNVLDTKRIKTAGIEAHQTGIWHFWYGNSKNINYVQLWKIVKQVMK